jgi:hypothetical protein
MFNILYQQFNNNIFFKSFSDIYVKEFFRYISIKTNKDINDIIIPTIEIDNILYKIIHNSKIIDDINKELLLNNHNEIKYYIDNKYYYTDEEIERGQKNLIKYMNIIFNYNIITTYISKINLIIKYNDIIIEIKVYNNDKIIDIKNEIFNSLKNQNILLSPKRMILIFNKLTLDNYNTLDHYNIKNNDIIKVLINMNISV